MKTRIRAALVTVALVALGLWMGGLIALGPIAAPVVFRMVPAPLSGGAMAIVFRRFDKLAVACAAVALLLEAPLALLRDRRITRVDVARALAVASGLALALYMGASVSPRIEELHRAGAIRGLGSAGQSLERAHALAERLGQAELVLGIAVVLLHVIALSGPHGDKP